MDKYVDTLGEYAKDAIEQMFDSCTFDVWKTSYTSDVEVTSDGIATIYMNSNVWFDGDNPSLPRDKIVAEIKQRIDFDGEGLVPVTWGLELTSADKN